MSVRNVTYDDFDPVIVYSNPADWSTPNPQDNPGWFNATSDVTGSIWHQATYHSTEVAGTKISFNFTGTGLYVYGGSGPEYGNYTLTIDPSIPTPFIYPGQAYSQQNGTDRYLLYGTDGLAYAEHEVVIETQGGRFLLDLVEVGGLEFGAEGFVLLR
ncbi:hypothetical protein HD553DRAFT_160238 [Filobasidium floriforme]|uniref:uncharacterized protein n=1 Tax=Filobasidium floriforme TaxID=5210 RepID=UPI001E8E5EA2|nr:uncharacterized protein HD553DRAFT_160238 [Filobasidium floriforme]KAH8089248.1 hypothetical protein HD553DRAFT_160238 [Filobasidium floriforme]